MVNLTPRAAHKLTELLGKEGKPAGFLRVKVSTGGCSGMSLAFDLTDQKADEDKVYESNGAKVVVDPKSEFFLFGSTVDYEQSMMQSGFALENPNAKSTCSCGKSFST